MTSSLDRPALALGTGPDLRAHLALHGPLPAADATALAERAGLTGRGGAGFPTAAKLRSVAAAAAAGGRRPVVVANAAEGEPASAKDAVLLSASPHLVLDGLALVAATLGADLRVVAAPAGRLPGVSAALAQRPELGPVRLHATADRFLAGEESALVAAVDGGAPLPRTKLPPVRERGVAGRPTLVANTETLARLALLARGDTGAGSGRLVTRWVEQDGVVRTDVADVAAGTRIGDLVPLTAGEQAVLVGGYHGTWLPAAVARDARLDREELAAVGASPGAGVLAALPRDRCGLRETARVVSWLAAQSAGQCGPCLNGLPRIAAALELVARPGPLPPRLLDDVARWCGLVAGRGACRHPDGSARLVASALRVFAGEAELHRAGVCGAASAAPFLPTPAVRP